MPHLWRRKQDAAPVGRGRLSGRVVTATWLLCVLFIITSIGIGVLGILGVRAAKDLGNAITADELTSTGLIVDLGRALSEVQSNSQALLLSPPSADRGPLTAAVFDERVPEVEARLADLRRAHVHDSAAEAADLRLLADQWSTARQMVGLAVASSAGADPAMATRVAAAFEVLSSHLQQLAAHEQSDAVVQEQQTDRAATASIRALVLGVAGAVAVSILCGFSAARRNRRALEPTEDQVRYADTLQMAQDEQEAHLILQRHLEAGLGDGSVTILNRNNSADRLEAVTAVPPGSVLARTLPHARPSSCLAVRSGRLHVEDDSRTTLLGCPVCGPCPGRSACSPLTVGGVVIGSVLVNGPRVLERRYEQRVRESVGQAAPVLANLRNLAIAEVRAATDALTALPNKRTVNDTLMRMLAQAARTLTPLCLLTLDLDHFKQVNDRFGHPVGDQALASVGAVLRAALRAGDFAGRNGGEEFSVMLPDTDVAGALVTAEKIRVAVSEIVLPGVDVVLTVSIGIAAYPEHALTAERLERLADSALYVAKRSGRNRVEVASTVADPALPASAGTELLPWAGAGPALQSPADNSPMIIR